MAEIAIGQIIKMTIAVAVMAIVIGGVALSYSKYIAPYFAVDEEPPKDISTAYYKSLMDPKNVVAFVLKGSNDGEFYLYIKSTGKKTTYYFRGVDIYQDINWALDPSVGKIDKGSGKIKIDSSYLAKDSDLGVIEGAEKIGVEIYKVV